ncbi:hypothetical protein Glove_326g170 [Diversispora epigaea]|uniref:Uncharacterized protein n=1 Tax=Diversispora epigaea TaxID=1348612 RepID=A0A397HUE7_9GLOM|nr:hypothetical protein Glove_326g170 [Diversispora epigaea]
MLKSTPSMGRTMDKSQEIFKPGSTFTLERETRNGQIKTPVEEVNGNGIKESNGTTIHNRSAEKSDSPLSHSTPNDSSEMSSLSESPSLMQDDLKPKVVAGITSEDETSVILDTTESNRKSKKRRWDDRGQIDEEDEGNPAVRSKLEEPAECNNQTEELTTIEVDFKKLREQLYLEQIREHDKDLEDVRKGVHSEQKLRMEEIEKKRSRRLDVIASRKRYQELHCQKQFEEAQCRLRYQFLADSRELRNRMLESFETWKYELIREKNRSGRLEYSEPDRNYLRQQQEQRIIEFAYLQENHGFPADILKYK